MKLEYKSHLIVVIQDNENKSWCFEICKRDKQGKLQKQSMAHGEDFQSDNIALIEAKEIVDEEIQKQKNLFRSPKDDH